MIAPLDWGLGHATRCIPLIHELNRKGAIVIIAATGAIKNLLQEEFPSNSFISVPPYNISYASNPKFLIWHLFSQAPRVIATIVKEHWLLKRIVKQHAIDVVISDNRFGLFHSSVKTIYITHQLSFQTGNTLFNKLASKIHHWFIRKYSCCWVPDFEEQPVAGLLSHSPQKIENIKYIGCLSRFQKLDQVEKQYDLLVLISGPEPMRTTFENLILDQAQSYSGKMLLIRGLPGNKHILQNKQSNKQNIVFKNHVNARKLSDLIQQSELVVCRSGYTSIMDLIKLKKKAIMVPTPGQPEQEYLADYLAEKKIFYTVQQQNFVLVNAISNAKQFAYQLLSVNTNGYIEIVNDLLNTVVEQKH